MQASQIFLKKIIFFQTIVTQMCTNYINFVALKPREKIAISDHY